MPYKDPTKQKEYFRSYNKARRANNPVSVQTQAIQWNKENPKRQQFVTYIINLKKKYNVTFVSYLASLEFQNYKCACCKTSKWGDGRIKRPCVDHDHATMEFRGLICYVCNVTLGKLGDSAKNVMRSAQQFINYLEKRS